MSDDKRVLEGLRYCAKHGICGHKGGEACPLYEECLKSETGYPQRAAVELIERLTAELGEKRMVHQNTYVHAAPFREHAEKMRAESDRFAEELKEMDAITVSVKSRLRRFGLIGGRRDDG